MIGDPRHLRYFRITFSQGKLIVKQCKQSKQMRTFQLKDLLSFKVLKCALDAPQISHANQQGRLLT